MIKISRRIELEDIVLNKDNWKQVKNNLPCYFKASWGKDFWAGVVLDIKEIPADVTVFFAMKEITIGVVR